MHSVIAPSSAHRWVNCPGSIRMCRDYPDTRSEAAAEGTGAHDLAAQWLNGNTPDVNHPAFESVRVYVDDIRAKLTDTSVVGIEYMVNCPNVHEKSYGTVDCYMYDQTSGKLTLWDYKHGFGVVDPYENWQMINYASGLLDIHTDVREVEMRIVQPRAFVRSGPVRSWSVNVKHLQTYIDRLQRAAAKALGHSAECNAGEWCRYCRARHACPTLQQAGYVIMDRQCATMPHELTDEQLGKELANVQNEMKRLEYYKLALEEQVTDKLKHGSVVQGYTLKTGTGREKWSKSPEEVITMGNLLGVDLAAPVQPITPAAARKAGIDPAIVKQYTVPRTGIKLERDNGNEARRIFGGK